MSRRIAGNMALAAVILLGAASIGGWFFYQFMAERIKEQAEEELAQKAQQTADQMSDVVAVIAGQLKSLSEEAPLITLFQSADKDGLASEAQNRLSEFEKGLKLRFFLPGQYERDGAAVPPLGFRSVTLLEQAEQTHGPVGMEVHFHGSPQEHVIAIQPVFDNRGELVGLIHLSLDVEIAEQLLAGMQTTDAYMEIEQTGIGKKLVLAKAGVTPTDQPGKVTRAIEGTRWRVAYWGTGGMTAVSGQGGWLTPAIIAIIALIILIVLFPRARGGFYIMRNRVMGNGSRAGSGEAATPQTVYAGAVLAIMEGAHPGMEKLIPNLPIVITKTPTEAHHPERAVGDDITMIARGEDREKAAGTEP